MKPYPKSTRVKRTPLALDENNITAIGNGISCRLIVFVTRLCLGIFDTNKGSRNTKRLLLPMPLGINEVNHKKNSKEPKSSQTENHLRRLNLRGGAARHRGSILTSHLAAPGLISTVSQEKLSMLLRLINSVG